MDTNFTVTTIISGDSIRVDDGATALIKSGVIANEVKESQSKMPDKTFLFEKPRNVFRHDKMDFSEFTWTN